METQFSLGSADNKGILSLLSAIEQVVCGLGLIQGVFKGVLVPC